MILLLCPVFLCHLHSRRTKPTYSTMKCFHRDFFLVSAMMMMTTSQVQAFTPILRSTRRMNIKPTKALAPPAMSVPISGGDTVPPANSEGNQGLAALAAEDAWIGTLDYEGFGRDVAQLGKELLRETGPEDEAHLHKIVRWRNAAAIIGMATMWMPPNPLTMAALSTWTYASWTMIAHHTCHGGYNRVSSGKQTTNESVKNKKVRSVYNSRNFALGSLQRRVLDWLDWMKPEAWNVEHNRLHHYRLNELEDPDLVQRNLEFVRQDNKLPLWLKYTKVFAFMSIWKWFYYAPNTFKELQIAKWMAETGQQLPAEIDRTQALTVRSFVAPDSESERALLKIVKPVTFFSQVVAPFFFMRFVLLPLPLLAIPGGQGMTLFQNAIINLVAAELLTNIHAFVTIVTNHAGDDLYTFEDAVKPKTPSFYVRQVIGSANYKAGSDPIDFAHGFLNYQVEHHVWPDLSMLQYQRGAPRLKAICEQYGVPYIQESVWERTKKALCIMVGKATMRPFPIEYEPAKDKALKGVTWKSTNGAIDEEDEK